jgi:hypothetical protein
MSSFEFELSAACLNGVLTGWLWLGQGFELECAGAAGGQALLCNGTVSLRLEEWDDWARLAGRVSHWAAARRECEDAGRCASARVFFVVSSPIPGIRWAGLRELPVACVLFGLSRCLLMTDEFSFLER